MLLKYVRAVILIIFFSQSISPAMGDSADIYSLRSAYLFHFVQYITWSDEIIEETDTVVCALTRDPKRQESLSAFFSTEADGKNRLNITFPFEGEDWVGSLKKCRMTYIAEDVDTQKIQEQVKFTQANVTVTEGSCLERGVIHLYLDKGKLRFEIDEQKLRTHSAFKISSRLLRLSKRSRR